MFLSLAVEFNKIIMHLKSSGDFLGSTLNDKKEV